MGYETILKDLVVIAGVPVFRSVAGWATKALADSNVTKFEWKQLTSTVVRVGSIGLMAYFGLSITGIDNAAIAAAVAAYFADKVFKAMKENKNVTKR